MNLQSHFDEQAEVHERLLCARTITEEDFKKGCEKTADDFRHYLTVTKPKLDNPFVSWDAINHLQYNDPYKPMKSYTTGEPGVDVPGKGLTFYIKGDWDEYPPKVGEIVKINGETYRANYVSHWRSDASKFLYLEIGTTPLGAWLSVPQPITPNPSPSEAQDGTKSLLGEIEALKAKVRELEADLDSWRQLALGGSWRLRRSD